MEYPKTDRNRVKRLADRGAYDRESIFAILDEGLVCHVGLAHGGQPLVLPTLHARDGEVLYLHGARANRMLGAAARGEPVCAAVTLVDGLVLARSAFHHSVNYRSAVIFGTGREVSDGPGKLRALELLTERLAPGRWAETRPPAPQELAKTMVVAIPIDTASAKVRTGPPVDDAEDYALPHWAGVLPLSLRAEAPVDDPRLSPGIPLAPSVAALARRLGGGVS